MARTSKRVASQHTQARLTKVMAQAGRDALQPSSTLLATPWAAGVMLAQRVVVLSALKLASNGSIGFDYGPVGLTLLRWITVNRMARAADAAALWLQAQATPLAPDVATPVAAPLAAPLPKATPTIPAPAIPATPAAQPFPPAAGFPPVITPEVAQQIVQQAEVLAAQPVEQHAKTAAVLSPAEVKHPEWDWQPAAKVFNVKGLRGNVAVWPRADVEGAHPRTPEVDADYVWTKEHLQWAVFAASESPAKGMWYWGNRGAGKTEFAKQFAAQTGRPFFGVTFTRTMEPSEFLGDMGAANGESVWQDGTILQGLKCKVPAVIMLDEISYGQSSHVSGPLNEIVHPACSFTVPRTGERVRFTDGHLFIAADNTNGTGDPSGMYVGANTLNRATMDRFAFFRRFTYLPKALEVRLLTKRAQCDEATATRVWGILDSLRKKVDSGLLSDPPSTREAIALCCALRAGFDEKDAFETCFVGKYAEESQEEMRVTFTAMFNATPGTPAA